MTDLPNNLHTLSPGDPVWFLTGRGEVVEFVLLSLTPPESWYQGRCWFVVGMLGEVRDPLWCFPTREAAEDRARECRRARREQAKAELAEIGEAGA